MSAGPAPLAPGSAIAPAYVVIEHLSRGRALDVYDVWSDERECRCIAKMLRPDRAKDQAARRRLVREGRLLRGLSHPHIVRGYELLPPPRPLVIMETLSGETLARLIEDGDQRPCPSSSRIWGSSSARRSNTCTATTFSTSI